MSSVSVALLAVLSTFICYYSDVGPGHGRFLSLIFFFFSLPGPSFCLVVKTLLLLTGCWYYYNSTPALLPPFLQVSLSGSTVLYFFFLFLVGFSFVAVYRYAYALKQVTFAFGECYSLCRRGKSSPGLDYGFVLTLCMQTDIHSLDYIQLYIRLFYSFLTFIIYSQHSLSSRLSIFSSSPQLPRNKFMPNLIL